MNKPKGSPMSVIAPSALCVLMMGIPQEASTARDVLERMERAYRECKTYADTGVVTKVYHFKIGEDEEERTERFPFLTRFAKPGKFLYEFKKQRKENDHDRYLVWRDGCDIRTWWDLDPGVKTELSISQALAGPRFISGGSAHTIPPLLMRGEVSGPSLMELTELTLLEEGAIGERMMIKITGVLGAGPPLTLWIDKNTYLLHRIESTDNLPTFRVESVADYNPKINISIQPELLEFDPPALPK